MSESLPLGQFEEFSSFDNVDIAEDFYPDGFATQGDQDALPKLPPDFSSDEWTLIEDFKRSFNVENEDLPPLFAETLGAPLHYPTISEGFEQRVTSRVFRNLHLRRRLFSPPKGLPRLVPHWALRQSVLKVSALLCVLMMLSTIAAAPSFGRGLHILLVGPTGVYQVERYPQHYVSYGQQCITVGVANRVDIQKALGALPFSLYLPKPPTLPLDYRRDPLIQLCTGQPHIIGQSVDLEFMGSQGGEIDILEFLPAPGYKVFQAAQDGSAQSFCLRKGSHGIDLAPVIQRDGSVQLLCLEKSTYPAVYVSGGWNLQGIWGTGNRSSMIYERDGVAFWIVSTGLHPLNAEALGAIALSLQPVNNQVIAQYEENLRLVSTLLAAGVLAKPGGIDEVLVAVQSARTPGTPTFYRTGH